MNKEQDALGEAKAGILNWVHSTRARLLLLLVAAVLPMAGLVIYNTQEAEELAVAGALREASALADVASARQDLLVLQTYQLLSFVAQQPEVRDRNAGSCSEYLVEVMRQYPAYTNLVVADIGGDLHCSGTTLAGPTNVSERENFRRTLEARGFTVGDYQIGRTSGRAVLGFGYPVFDMQGELAGAVFAALDLGWLGQYLSVLDLPSGAAVTVMDNKGIVLARYPEPTGWVGKSVADEPITRTVLAEGGVGTAETEGLDGEPRLIAYRQLGLPIESGNLYVLVSMLRETALAQAERELRQSLAVLAVISVLAIGLSWAFLELLVVKRVRALVQSTQRIAAGDFQPAPGFKEERGELGELARALDRMARDLEQREQERARLEESRLQLAEERTRRMRGEILVREVDHRVKNSLQLAASVLSLQAAYSSEPIAKEALLESEGRIRAMAAVHSKLKSTESDTVADFGEYLSDLLPAMVGAYADPARITLKVQAASLLLGSDHSVPCALIVNELLTNALKHAFPNSRKGIVIVRAGAAADGAATLSVEDNGIGLSPVVDVANAKTLGFQIINALVAQLKGTLTVNREGGTSITITFPLEKSHGPTDTGGRG